ncbi:hypothetical protein SEA_PENGUINLOVER67_86 [Mycobacterium phage PenguinLover67]|nr:hypothetical protein SEA_PENGUINLOVER67_86 [Mycobacterium phage PenguinLover67]
MTDQPVTEGDLRAVLALEAVYEGMSAAEVGGE